MLLSIHSAASQSYKAKPRRREYLKRFQDLLNRIPLGTNLSRASDGNYSGKDERTTRKQHGRRPGAKFGGTTTNFRGPISGKISIFRVKISDDLFFSHRPGSSDFSFLFPHFPYVYYVICRI